MKRGFTCGVFDLFNAGHVTMLRNAKKVCDYLIVGLQTDPTIDRRDKNKPIQSVLERSIVLHACRFVDQLIVYETEKDLEDILDTMNIDVRILGFDHTADKFLTGAEICKQRGIEMIYQRRGGRWSTSELRKRMGI